MCQEALDLLVHIEELLHEQPIEKKISEATSSLRAVVALLEDAETPPQPENTMPNEKQELLDAIRNNMSPEAVSTIIAFLQPAAFYRPANDDARKAFREVGWFRDTLTEMLGVESHNRMIEDLGL